MKKTISIISIILALTISANAQFTKPQGGSGLTSTASGTLLISTADPLRFTAISTSTLMTLLNAITSAYASSTFATGTNYWAANGTSIYKINTGNVGIGTDAPSSTLEVSTNWPSSSGTNLSFTGTSYTDATRMVLRRANGTSTAPTAIASGDTLGNINFRGHDGTNFSVAALAAINGIADEAFTSTAQGTRMTFSTTATGSVTGLERMRIMSNGLIGIGTTTPQSLLTVASSTAGGTNSLFQVSTSSVLFNVLANGFVGIGTTTPVALLHLAGGGMLLENNQFIQQKGSGGTANNILGMDSSNVLMLANKTTGGPITFNTQSGGVEQMRILSGGNVGIGTTTPVSLLVVASTSQAFSTFTNTTNARMSTFGLVDGFNLRIGQSAGTIENLIGATTWLSLGTGGVASSFPTGNVGIGTTTPSSDLTVYTVNNNTTLATLGTPDIAITNTSQTNNSFASLAFRTLNASGTETTGSRLSSIFTNHAVGAESGDLAFLNMSAGTLAERMRLTAAGNLGIGSTTPTDKLAVVGSAVFGTGVAASRYSIFDTSGRLSVNYHDNSSPAGITLNNFGITAANQGMSILAQFSSSTAGAAAGNPASGRIRFISEDDYSTAAASDGALTIDTSLNGNLSERMRVTSAGLVGIGTSTPDSLLMIKGASGGTTPLFNLASSSATVYNLKVFPNGHISASSTAPTLSSCGTSPTVRGDDKWGEITVGSVSATGCVITFAQAYTNSPSCIITNQSMSVVNAMTYTISTTAVTVSQTGLTGSKLNYHCMAIND